MTEENYSPKVCPYNNLRDVVDSGCGDCQKDKSNCLIEFINATGNIMDHAHLEEGF